jgi:ABC-type glycerol-3-phosphate transport system permease component
MLITIALAVLGAYLISKLSLKWWAWLPTALLTGVAVSLLASIALGLTGFLTAEQVGYQGAYNAPLGSGVCALYAWWLSRRRKADV